MARTFEGWMNRNHIRSTIVLTIAVGMLVWVTHWSMDFSRSGLMSGLDMAAVIAAVQVPASFFAKWAFETYAGIFK